MQKMTKLQGLSALLAYLSDAQGLQPDVLLVRGDRSAEAQEAVEGGDELVPFDLSLWRA